MYIKYILTYIRTHTHTHTHTHTFSLTHRHIDQRKFHNTFLPLDCRNQESEQIPGFYDPMVKGTMQFFSDHKSRPTRDWAFCPPVLSVMYINLQVLSDRWDDLCSCLSRVYLETRELNHGTRFWITTRNLYRFLVSVIQWLKGVMEFFSDHTYI